jgi:formylmethanofuran dehydrogenase subunit E
MNVPDNYDMWERQDCALEKELDKLPECEECGWPIQSTFYYEINDTIICPDCLNNFKKRTEDYA